MASRRLPRKPCAGRLDDAPKDAGVRLDLAQLLAQLGKTAQAKPILDDLIKEQPNNLQALDSLFRICVVMKNVEAAKAAAEAIVAIQPNGPVGYLYEGILAEQTNHLDEALRLYGRAADLQPDALEPLQAQIRLYVTSKRIPDALKRLDQVTAQSPTIALAPNLKGDVLLGQKNLDGAQAAFKTAIERNRNGSFRTGDSPRRNWPRTTPARHLPRCAPPTPRWISAISGMEIAALDEKTGKPDEAIREYDDVLRRYPESDVAANNLAMMLVTYGKDAASLDRGQGAGRPLRELVQSALSRHLWVGPVQARRGGGVGAGFAARRQQGARCRGGPLPPGDGPVAVGQYGGGARQPHPCGQFWHPVFRSRGGQGDSRQTREAFIRCGPDLLRTAPEDASG